MTDHDLTGTGGNIFARKLENILNAHHSSMSQLEDAGIPLEKVRRMIKSLQTPKVFPIFTAEELALIEYRFRLDDEDMLHLQAALLATSIQKTLVHRMSQDGALLVTEQIFPLIVQDLLEQGQNSRVNDVLRSGASEPIADDEFEAFFDTIWQNIDDAEMSMQLSYGIGSQSEGIEKAHAAQVSFELAAIKLKRANTNIHALTLWQNCYTTSQQGIMDAKRRLEDLGA